MLQFTTFSQIITSINEILKTVKGSVAYRIAEAGQPRSLTEFRKIAQVEPLTIISRDLLVEKDLPDVMNTLLNNFMGHYLQALALTVSVDSSRVISTLDRLNPDRDVTIGDYAQVIGIGTESLATMPVLNKNAYAFRLPRVSHALEADKSSTMIEQKVNNVAHVRPPITTGIPGTITKIEQEESESFTFGSDSNKIISELANLAVGKYIDVTFTSSGSIEFTDSVPTPTNQNQNRPRNGVRESKLPSENDKSTKSSTTMSIPVNVRLAPMVIPNSSIEHILTISTDDNSIEERFHSWRAGRIRFIQDLIFCQDLIDEHKKALMKDESGAYIEIMRRVANATKKGLLTKNPSLASASNLFVISEDVAKAIEFKLGGKLSNARIRQKAFENTYAMILAVFDREWGRVTFYYRGIATSTNVSIQELKSLSKSKGPDILDIFKALNSGSAPSF